MPDSTNTGALGTLKGIASAIWSVPQMVWSLITRKDS